MKLQIILYGKPCEAQPMRPNGLGLMCSVPGFAHPVMVMSYMAVDEQEFQRVWQSLGGARGIVWEDGSPFRPPGQATDCEPCAAKVGWLTRCWRWLVAHVFDQTAVLLIAVLLGCAPNSQITGGIVVGKHYHEAWLESTTETEMVDDHLVTVQKFVQHPERWEFIIADDQGRSRRLDVGRESFERVSRGDYWSEQGGAVKKGVVENN